MSAIHPACRSGAERTTITFAGLVPGDFMTAEEGPEARWVRVLEVEEFVGRIVVSFQTPTIEGSGWGHDRWTIDRIPSEPVVIDARCRQ